MKKCRCEHIAHSDTAARTPNGNPGHHPGQGFSDNSIVTVQTTYGKMEVCKDCARDCYHEFPLVTSNCNSLVSGVQYTQNEIRRCTEMLEKLLDEYSIATSGIVIVESVIATLSELANGQG